MATVTFAQVMTQLNVNKKQLLLLMKNPQFPLETGGTSSDTATFTDTQINAFQTLINNSKANGYVLTESVLESANFTTMAAGPAPKYSQKYYTDAVDVMLVQNTATI
jgi:hypothetical protein